MHFLFFLSFLGWLLMQAIQNQRVTKRLSTAYEANMLENALRVSIPPLSMPATRILAALLPAPTSLMQFLTPFPPNTTRNRSLERKVTLRRRPRSGKPSRSTTMPVPTCPLCKPTTRLKIRRLVGPSLRLLGLSCFGS